eukprot:scaffold629772_cov25-Prasinocladus_malaysianus.AAC.1
MNLERKEIEWNGTSGIGWNTTKLNEMIWMEWNGMECNKLEEDGLDWDGRGGGEMGRMECHELNENSSK